MDPLIQQLKKLKGISPDPRFGHTSKFLIFKETAAPRPHFSFAQFLNWKTGSVVALASLTLIIFSVIPSTSLVARALDTEDLTEEFTTLSINIELKKISYDQAVGKTVASALNEVSTESAHLNARVLESEMNALLKESETQRDVDELLKTLTL